MMASTVAGAASAQAADPAAAANTLQGQFASAAAEFHIPQSVLLALSYQETRWDSHQGQPSTTGNYNVMGLTDVDVAATDAAVAADAPEVDQSGSGTPAPNAVPAPAKVVDSPALHTLDAAAKLINQPDAALRTDSAQSIRGAAALLAQYQQQAGKPAAADPGAWYGAVVQFGQLPGGRRRHRLRQPGLQHAAPGRLAGDRRGPERHAGRRPGPAAPAGRVRAARGHPRRPHRVPHHPELRGGARGLGQLQHRAPGDRHAIRSTPPS